MLKISQLTLEVGEPPFSAGLAASFQHAVKRKSPSHCLLQPFDTGRIGHDDHPCHSRLLGHNFGNLGPTICLQPFHIRRRSCNDQPCYFSLSFFGLPLAISVSSSYSSKWRGLFRSLPDTRGIFVMLRELFLLPTCQFESTRSTGHVPDAKRTAGRFP